MKNKIILSIFTVLTLVGLAVVSLPPNAAVADSSYTRKSDLNTIDNLTGGTNNVAVSSTNTYAAFDVSEVDYFGMQLSFKGTAAGTSTVQLLGYQSINSTDYETTPSFNKLVTLNGTTLVTTNFDVFVPGSASFKLVIGNTNASVGVTNIAGANRQKAPRRGHRL